MEWLNEEYDDTDKMYNAECSNCRCISVYYCKISEHYTFCPFCGEQVEKEVENS